MCGLRFIYVKINTASNKRIVNNSSKRQHEWNGARDSEGLHIICLNLGLLQQKVVTTGTARTVSNTGGSILST